MSAALRSAIECYLREAPLFAAIVRGVECALLAEAGPLKAPVLDLGCGDGVFAVAAFREAPACGIDPSFAVIREARDRRSATMHCVADATRLPFAGGAFQTVVCNSVFEHIPDLEAALANAAHVLAPGGRMILTSPSAHFGAMLFGTRALAGLGLTNMGAAYARWFNGHSLHFHTHSMAEWEARLQRNGFRVSTAFHYLSPHAHGVFDLLHYGSAWRWIRRRLTGRWASGRDSWSNRFWARRLYALTKDSWPAEQGPYLYIDATRQ